MLARLKKKKKNRKKNKKNKTKQKLKKENIVMEILFQTSW